MFTQISLLWIGALAQLTLAVAFGYWLGKACRPKSQPRESARRTPPIEPSAACVPEVVVAVATNASGERLYEQLRTVLAEVHDLAKGVADDVGEHTTRVEKVSQELASSSQAGGISEQVIGEALERILSANRDLSARLRDSDRRLTEQSQLFKQQETLALTDPLTGIANRRSFDLRLSEALSASRQQGAPLSLMMVDVDFFKKFNDTFGHQAGDAVLRNIAQTLEQTVRKKDIATRFGGEEFALILPGANMQAAQKTVLRVLDAVRKARCSFEGRMLQSTISAGLAEATQSDSVESLLARADEALYAAKHNGRDRGYLQNGANVEPVMPVKSEVAAQSIYGGRLDGLRRVAPYHGELPKMEEFRELQCRETPPDGLAIYSLTDLHADEFVVEVQTARSTEYFLAERQQAIPLSDDPRAGFCIECLVTGQINPATTKAIREPGAQTAGAA